MRRFPGRWEAVAKVLPYCYEAEFYDNGFALVAEYRNGELRTVGSRRPQWLMELLKYLNASEKNRHGGGSIYKSPMVGYTEHRKGYCDKRLTL